MRWPRWLDRRPRHADISPPAWDASVDLDPAELPGGIAPDRAAAAVTAALQALPGAGWVSVEVHPSRGSAPIRVFPAGTSVERAEEPWPGVRRRIADAARRSLIGVASSSRLHGSPAAGFAEVSQAFALEQLASLAASVQQPAADAAPSDEPLLLRLLDFVLPGDNRRVADSALARFGGFASVLAAPEAELRQVRGLGTHSIAAIKLVHAAAVRLARADAAAEPVLDSRERLYAYLSAVLARERIEQFRILFLDERGMLKADLVQGTGTVNHTPVYPREVVRRALEFGAASVVLVHNHPSGDPEPSQEDIGMTAMVQRAAAAVSIEVRDHIVVGYGRWVSFREAGLL